MDQNSFNVIPYKPGARLAIMTAIAEAEDANVQRALRTLTQATVGAAEVTLVKKVPADATTETYRQKNLIVKALATLSDHLYQAYLSLKMSALSA